MDNCRWLNLNYLYGMQISIIMPVYNAEKWIVETISSIQSQSFTDWELICIDDFSTDESMRRIAEFQKHDARIRSVSTKIKGIIPALQLGLQLSTGEYITRMDADDLMPPNRLQTMHDALLHADSKTIVTGKVKYFSEALVSEGYQRYEHWLNERVTHLDHFDHIYRECVIASPNWLARTAELRSDAIFEQLKYPEDYDMMFHWKANNYKITAISEVTLLWREHPERTSRNSEVYDQASFFALKLDWFLTLNATSAELAVLGAGAKGKITAKFLNDREIPFNWYDFKAENYPAPLFGKNIQTYEDLNESHLLIAIYPKNLKDLATFLSEKGYVIGRNAWFL